MVSMKLYHKVQYHNTTIKSQAVIDFGGYDFNRLWKGVKKKTNTNFSCFPHEREKSVWISLISYCTTRFNTKNSRLILRGSLVCLNFSLLYSIVHLTLVVWLCFFRFKSLPLVSQQLYIALIYLDLSIVKIVMLCVS